MFFFRLHFRNSGPLTISGASTCGSLRRTCLLRDSTIGFLVTMLPAHIRGWRQRLRIRLVFAHWGSFAAFAEDSRTTITSGCRVGAVHHTNECNSICGPFPAPRRIALTRWNSRALAPLPHSLQRTEITVAKRLRRRARFPEVNNDNLAGYDSGRFRQVRTSGRDPDSCRIFLVYSLPPGTAPTAVRPTPGVFAFVSAPRRNRASRSRPRPSR